MQKIIILVLNIIAGLPLLAFPVLWLLLALTGDAGGSGDTFWGKYGTLLIIIYPIFIGFSIFFSRKYHSLLLASIACVPFVVLVVLSYFFLKR